MLFSLAHKHKHKAHKRKHKHKKNEHVCMSMKCAEYLRTKNFKGKRIKQSIRYTSHYYPTRRNFPSAACNPLSDIIESPPGNNEPSRPFRTISPHCTRELCAYINVLTELHHFSPVMFSGLVFESSQVERASEGNGRDQAQTRLEQ